MPSPSSQTPTAGQMGSWVWVQCTKKYMSHWAALPTSSPSHRPTRVPSHSQHFLSNHMLHFVFSSICHQFTVLVKAKLMSGLETFLPVLYFWLVGPTSGLCRSLTHNVHSGPQTLFGGLQKWAISSLLSCWVQQPFPVPPSQKYWKEKVDCNGSHGPNLWNHSSISNNVPNNFPFPLHSTLSLNFPRLHGSFFSTVGLFLTSP